jgi:hypothetical protein
MIMTLVFDKSEDVSQQLLSVLLPSLRREKWDASPAAHALDLNVIIPIFPIILFGR